MPDVKIIADLAEHEQSRVAILEDGRLTDMNSALHPIGGFVKSLMRENVIAGWHEMNIVRVSIGTYDPLKGCVMMNA